MGRTCVLVRDGQPRVYGDHTLTADAVRREEFPPEAVKGLPQLPVPVALLGRLAVDASVHGHGLGRLLLLDALARVTGPANPLGVFAVTVDALDEEAAAFYAKYGFLRLPARPDRLFLPLKGLRTEAGS